ncbi:MAG: hypothetical protein AB4426_21335, partial [Xenococcaceae cyanobacterium]
MPHTDFFILAQYLIVTICFRSRRPAQIESKWSFETAVLYLTHIMMSDFQADPSRDCYHSTS